MVEVMREHANRIAPLFRGWNETLIDSFLQGYMGRAWADNLAAPASAQILVGDFCFFAGIPDAQLVRNIPSAFQPDFLLMIPQNEDWSSLIEKTYGERCERTLRYAIKKEPRVFHREKLHSYAEKIKPPYRLRMIDETLYRRAKAEPWSRDLCSQFPVYKDYQAHGIGVMALSGGSPVSGASSYCVYDNGIEIEVDTKSDFRRQGLALACCAKLILECMERKIYPSWDAHDLRSVSLAERLGYHLDHPYTAYTVSKLHQR